MGIGAYRGDVGAGPNIRRPQNRLSAGRGGDNQPAVCRQFCRILGCMHPKSFGLGTVAVGLQRRLVAAPYPDFTAGGQRF
ncbi:hypothetical protein D3C78_1299640 [compost metagenome]